MIHYLKTIKDVVSSKKTSVIKKRPKVKMINIPRNYKVNLFITDPFETI